MYEINTNNVKETLLYGLKEGTNNKVMPLECDASGMLKTVSSVVIPPISLSSVQIEDSGSNIIDPATLTEQLVQTTALGTIDTSVQAVETAVTGLQGIGSKTLSDIYDAVDGLELSIGNIEVSADNIDLNTDTLETLIGTSNSSLASIDGKDFATETTLSSLEGKDFATETTLTSTNTKLDTIDTSVSDVETAVTALQGAGSKTLSDIYDAVDGLELSVGNIDINTDNLETLIGNSNSALSSIDTNTSTIALKDFATETTLDDVKTSVEATQSSIQNSLIVTEDLYSGLKTSNFGVNLTQYDLKSPDAVLISATSSDVTSCLLNTSSLQQNTEYLVVYQSDRFINTPGALIWILTSSHELELGLYDGNIVLGTVADYTTLSGAYFCCYPRISGATEVAQEFKVIYDKGEGIVFKDRPFGLDIGIEDFDLNGTKVDITSSCIKSSVDAGWDGYYFPCEYTTLKGRPVLIRAEYQWNSETLESYWIAVVDKDNNIGINSRNMIFGYECPYEAFGTNPETRWLFLADKSRSSGTVLEYYRLKNEFEVLERIETSLNDVISDDTLDYEVGKSLVQVKSIYVDKDTDSSVVPACDANGNTQVTIVAKGTNTEIEFADNITDIKANQTNKTQSTKITDGTDDIQFTDCLDLPANGKFIPVNAFVRDWETDEGHPINCDSIGNVKMVIVDKGTDNEIPLKSQYERITAASDYVFQADYTSGNLDKCIHKSATLNVQNREVYTYDGSNNLTSITRTSEAYGTAL